MTNYRNEARNVFKSLKLHYSKISESDLVKLVDMLNESILNSKYWKKITLNKVILFNKYIQFAEITGSGDYFDSRECITFNGDGFIGFCGDADQNNTKPITDTFIKWCTIISEEKKTK